MKVAAVAPSAIPPRIKASRTAPGCERRSAKRSCSQTSPTINPMAAASPKPDRRVTSARIAQDQRGARSGAGEQGTDHLSGGRAHCKELPARLPPARRPGDHRLRDRVRPAARLAHEDPLREDHVAVLIGQDDVEAVIARRHRIALVVAAVPGACDPLLRDQGDARGEGANRRVAAADDLYQRVGLVVADEELERHGEVRLLARAKEALDPRDLQRQVRGAGVVDEDRGQQRDGQEGDQQRRPEPPLTLLRAH